MHIIRVFVIGVLFVASATPAGALGGKLGVQVAAVNNKLSGELPNEGSWEGTTALGYGIVGELNLTPDISISLQPGYTPRHSSQVFKSRGQVTGQIDYDMNYLSLPLLVRVTGDPVGVRGFVTAGLDLNVLLDASINVGEGHADVTDTFQSTSLGALFGAGVMVPLGRSFLTFELRYEQGLDDIVVRNGDEIDQGLNSPSVKYRGVSLLAGYLFSLGGE